ncbi:hypothetical protein P3T36_003183 [Kitasatospora sp. MAP12-15]|uniref:hypothetical protein n=1 Tax=unclassified Kitasatospora TaxID=2633591 RepID=UPI002473A0E6|nr:hypothetical protein [Kitasatospora sp. MAP12-44]MDH6111159.1 hypothetical protein [Kitasatospora sp. MAP12-44]
MSDHVTGVQSVDALVVWCGALAGLAAAAGLLWRLTRGLRRSMRRVDEFVDDWNGTTGRPGVAPAHEGVMARLGGIETRLTAVEHELRPNSGSSMRDAIDRVDERTRSFAGG